LRSRFGFAAIMLPITARILAAGLAAFAAGAAAAGDLCPGRSDALGTERVLPVDARATPHVGRKHFAATLPLRPREIVLTFDDGPWPATTLPVLDALANECVRATFFVVGRQAAEFPELVRRAAAAGHSIATHTYSHPLLNRMPFAGAEAEIDRGIAAVARVLGDNAAPRVAPFFRFPGFASTPRLLDRLAQRGITVFGADVWASDWLPMPIDRGLARVTERLRAAGGGIVLLHDTRPQTAAMLPSLLRTLKRDGYRVVHATPSARDAVVAVPISSRSNDKTR
jgi:peptidoglycan/xylan/chitin deacetylase (PgdA/CDA1 family)